MRRYWELKDTKNKMDKIERIQMGKKSSVEKPIK
jgi:hypothetical protein